MENFYFWLSVVVILVMFIVLFLSMPKIVRLVDEIAEKKAKAKSSDSGEKQKHRYKTF